MSRPTFAPPRSTPPADAHRVGPVGRGARLAGCSLWLVATLACPAGVRAAAAWIREPLSEERIATDQSGWFPFSITPGSLPAGLDVGALLTTKPAGTLGPLTARGDHFYFEKAPDKPFRIWGVNFTKAKTFPDKADAPVIARHLARLGVNFVRLHHVTTELLDRAANDTQHFDPAKLDRLDYFIAQLIAEGIYINYNPLTDMWDTYKPADQIEDYAGLTKENRAAYFFGPGLLARQKNILAAMLAHRNPYTGRTYAEEPALAIIELINESSFFGSGETGDKSRMPKFYVDLLGRMFVGWAKAKYPSAARLQEAWGGLDADEDYELGKLKLIAVKTSPRYSTARVRDAALFYVWVEDTYYRSMITFVRGLGFKGLINGTNNWYGLPTVKAQLACDFMDIHGYQNQNMAAGQSGNRFDRRDFRVVQYAAVNYQEGYDSRHTIEWFNCTPFLKWQLGGVVGKPLVSSEWNWKAAGYFNSEGPVLVVAYGSLQDLAGFFQFEYDNVLSQRVGFNSLSEPTLAQFPMAALAYLRGYVAVAQEAIEFDVSDQELAQSYATTGARAYSFFQTPEVPLAISAVHKVRRRFLADGEARRPPDLGRLIRETRNPLRSDTGEIVWQVENHTNGIITVDAPKLQAAVGYFAGRTIELRNLAVRSPDLQAVSLVSVDDRPLGESHDMLLTVVGRMEYTGQVWRAQYQSLADWGRPPALFEPVQDEIRLENRSQGISVRALNEKGETRGEVAVTTRGTTHSFAVGRERTLWYRIAAK